MIFPPHFVRAIVRSCRGSTILPFQARMELPDCLREPRRRILRIALLPAWPPGARSDRGKMSEQVTQKPQRHPEPGFIGKILIVALVVALIAAVWKLQLVFILGFGAIIVAVALNNLAAPLVRWLHISHHFALALTTIALGLVAVGFLAAFGARTAAQFSALAEELPGAWEPPGLGLIPGRSGAGCSVSPTTRRRAPPPRSYRRFPLPAAC